MTYSVRLIKNHNNMYSTKLELLLCSIYLIGVIYLTEIIVFYGNVEKYPEYRRVSGSHPSGRNMGRNTILPER